MVVINKNNHFSFRGKLKISAQNKENMTSNGAENADFFKRRNVNILGGQRKLKNCLKFKVPNDSL